MLAAPHTYPRTHARARARTSSRAPQSCSRNANTRTMGVNARQTFLCPVWMMLICLLARGVCGSREWPKWGTTATAFHLPTVRSVRTCTELRQALGDARVLKILVADHIRCTRSSWPTPVLVRRNVEVTGEIKKTNELTGLKTVLSIDWADLAEAVIAERGAIAFFHHLLLLQDKDVAGGLNLNFIKSRKGATVVLAGDVVAVRSCSALPSSLVTIVNRMPRPEFLAGDQALHALGQGSLLIQDIGLWNQEVNTLWQICNTVYVCGVSSPDSPLARKYFVGNLVKATCSSPGGAPLSEAP